MLAAISRLGLAGAFISDSWEDASDRITGVFARFVYVLWRIDSPASEGSNGVSEQTMLLFARLTGGLRDAMGDSRSSDFSEHVSDGTICRFARLAGGLRDSTGDSRSSDSSEHVSDGIICRFARLVGGLSDGPPDASRFRERDEEAS